MVLVLPVSSLAAKVLKTLALSRILMKVGAARHESGIARSDALKNGQISVVPGRHRMTEKLRVHARRYRFQVIDKQPETGDCRGIPCYESVPS